MRKLNAMLTPLIVEGHSLGGHLAMAFARLFPDAGNDAQYEIAGRVA